MMTDVELQKTQTAVKVNMMLGCDVFGNIASAAM